MDRRLAMKSIGAYCLLESVMSRLAWPRAKVDQPEDEGVSRSIDSRQLDRFVSLEWPRSREHFDSVVFSPGGRLLAAGGRQPNSIQLVDTRSLDGSGREPRIKTRGPSPTLHLWHMNTCLVAQEFPAYLNDITTVGFDLEGKHVLTAEFARYVPIRERIRKNAKDYLHVPGGSEFSGQDLSVIGEGATVKVWNTLSGFEKLPPLSHEKSIVRLAAGHQFITAVDSGGSVKVWDAASGRPWASYTRGNISEGMSRLSGASFFSTAISPDATRVLIRTEAGRSERYDFYAGPVCEWKDPGDSRAPMTFSPDGGRFATWSRDGRPMLWDFKTMKVLRAFEPETHAPGAGRHGHSVMAFSSDGARLAFAWTEGSGFEAKDFVMHACVWDVGSGRRMSEAKAAGSRVRALAFTPQGDLRAAIGGDSMPQAKGPDTFVPLSIWHVLRN